MSLKAKKESGDDAKLEMTPMIDVVFLLLIFFMCAAKFKELEGQLNSYLPKNRGGKSSKNEKIDDIKIEVKQQGGEPALYVNNFPCTSFESLFNKLFSLASIAPNLPVTISPGGDTPFEYVIKTLNACAKAGLKDVSFSQPTSGN